MSGFFYKGRIRRLIFLIGLIVFFIFTGITNSNAQDVYAIVNNGNWNSGSTWSLSSGGVACGCTPDANTSAHIGEAGAMRVQFNVDGNAKGLTIYNNGVLDWTSNNRELYINNGGQLDVQLGGVLDENGSGTAQIIYLDATSTSLIVNGSLNIDRIRYDGGGTHSISGSGTLMIEDDFELNSAVTVSSSHTNFTVTDRFEYLSNNASFTNTGTLTVNNDILMSNSGSAFSNSSTVNIADDIIVNGANSSITNTGNLNLNGAGSSDIVLQADNITITNTGGNIVVGDDINCNSSSTNLAFSNTGTINIADDLLILGTSTSFTNTNTITFTGSDGDIFLRADNITFTNTGGTITITDDIAVNTSGTNLTFTNSGTISLTGASNSDFTIQGAGSSISNTNILSLGGTDGDIVFQADNISFNNNGGTLSIGDDISGNSSSTNLAFTNSGAVTVTGDMILNGAPTVVTNSGSINVGVTLTLGGSNSVLTNLLGGTIIAANDLSLRGGNSTVNNTGVINLTDDFRFRSNDNTLNNNGTLTSDDIAFEEDNCTIVNDGTITVGDDINVGSGDNDNTITNNASGTFSVLSRIGLGSTTNRFRVNNYGIFNLAEEINSGPTGVNAPSWYNYAGATANFSDNDVDNNNRLLLYANYNANTINYNGNLNQDIVTPQDAYWNLTLSGTSIKETQANLDINGNVSIEGSAGLNPNTNNNNLTIAGNWTNTSTNGNAFDQGTETVTFDGGSLQTITNASGEFFYNVDFTNVAGFVGSGNITTTGTLSMTAGIINMGTDKLVLGDAITNEGIFNYTSGTVIGKFERWIANASTATYSFPVGTVSNTNTANIDLNSGTTGGSLIAEYVTTNPGTVGLPLTDGLSTVSSTFSEGYWTFTAANSFANSDFDLTLDGSGMTSETFDAYTRILSRATSGNDWIVEGSHLPGVDPLANRAGMTTLSAEFALGVGDTPAAATTWYTLGGGGNWNDPTTWTQDGTGSLPLPVGGGVPATQDHVVILSGATVTMNLNNVTISSMELNGELFVGTTSGHDFTLISGNGHIYLQGSGGLDNFPDGVTSLFADASVGGTVEYNGSGLILDTQREFNHLILNLNNNSDVLVLLNDLTINGNFTLTKGVFQINDNSATTILNLTVNGTALVDANASMAVGQGNTIGAYTIQGSNMPGVGNYHNIFHQVTFSGDFTNNGSVRFTNQAAPVYNEFTSTGAVTVRFKGAADNTMSLFGTTDFYNLIIDKGNDQTYELEINSNNVSNFSLFGPNSVGRVQSAPFSEANPEVRKALWIFNGTLHLTGSISIPTLSEGNQNGGNGDYPIGQNAAMWIDGVNVAVYSTADDISEVPAGATGINATGSSSSNQALSLYGLFRISNGFFGTRASGGFIFWNAAAGNVLVEGGTVNVSQLRSAGGGAGTNSYIQSGGTVIVRGRSGQAGEVTTAYALFSMHLPDGVFNMSGGTLQVYGERGGGSVFINSDPGFYSISGGDVIVENWTGTNAEIASNAPFWNLTLDKNGGSATQIELITNTVQGETILNPDLVILNNLTIKTGVTFDHNGNDVEIGSDFVIENGGDYVYDSSKKNTTIINGVDNSVMAFYNRTGGINDEQRFWNLTIDKLSEKTISLASGKTDLTGNENNLLRIEGDFFKLLSGTLDQGAHSIRLYADTLVNYDDLTVFDITVTDESDPNGRNDLLKFRDDGGPAAIFITADTSRFGGIKQNSSDKVMTLISDVKIDYFLYKHGRMNLQDNKLTIDVLDTSPNANADNGTCNNCFSVSDMFVLDGNASDGGLSIYIPSNGLNPVDGTAVFEFPFGMGLDGFDATGANSKYTPAFATISNATDSGYVNLRPVDKVLATTNPTGDVLSYYWRVDYSGFTSGNKPDIEYQFTYNDIDLDGSGNEASFVPGKVLDDTPFTRSSEIPANINTTTNVITFNGDLGGGEPPFNLELANYTAGEPTRFTGSVEVYYSRGIRNAANAPWSTASYWTLGANTSFDPHDSRQTPASDYPKAGDIAYVGWVPWDDVIAQKGKPHGVEIRSTETFAELRFTQMLDVGGNPVERDYYSNFQYRPTVCINPGGIMNAVSVSGEGAFWLRSVSTNQVDPDFSSVDMGAFAAEDSAYMIYESTANVIYNNIPAEVPNLLIAGNGWGSWDREFEISTDITVKEDFELLGDVNLVLSSGSAGDFYVEGDLKIMELSVNNSGGNGEIAFPDDASRTIEILGNLELINQSAKVNIRNADATVVSSDLIVHGDILQDNIGGGGLQLSSGVGLDYVHLTLTGAGNHIFEQTSGADASLYSITVNKGADQSSSFSFNGNFTLDGPTNGVGIAKALTIDNGVAVINNSSTNIDLTTGDDDFNIPYTAGLQVTQGQVKVSGDDSGILLDGSLIIDGGAVDMDDAVGNGNNYIEYTASGNALIDISAGTLTVGSQIRGNLITTTSVLDYTQTGGDVVIGKNAAPEASRSVFEVHNTGSNFTYTGGTLTLVRQNTATPGVAALRILPTFSDITQTIVIGNADTPASQTDFGINANVPLAGLTISGGTNFPTGVLKINALTLTNTLTIDAGATLDGNGIDLTLESDFVNNGIYTPSANLTTFTTGASQQISGAGATDFYDFTKLGAGTLNTVIQFTINNQLTISAGIFDDNGNTIDLLGNATIDATHQSTGGAGDGLRFSGSAEQQLTRSGSGSGTIGILTLQNSNGVVIPEGNGYDFDIDGGLKMNGGVFNIGSSLVTLGENAVITSNASFSVTNMVKTNSSFTDGGLGKVYPSGYSGVFIYPVGEIKYTPVEIDFSVTGGTSGSTVGSIAVRPANEYHPTINDGTQGMPTKPDIDNVLQYYWTLRSNNLTGFTADIKVNYDQADVMVTETGYSEADYIPARILAFNNPTNDVNKYNKTDVNETTNEILFSAASVFNGVNENGISGDYFAGIDEAIPNNVATYTVDVDGGSVDGDSYDIAVPGGGAPSGAVVIIPNGFNLNFDIDNVTLYKTEIQNGGTLTIDDTEFHRLGIVEGIGDLKIVHNGAGNPSMPAADYGTFFSCTGGGLEYAGTSSYNILGGIPNIRNLTLSGSGDRNFPNNIVNVCEDLIVNGPTMNTNSGFGINVDNNLILDNGVININGSSTTVRSHFNNDLIINSGVWNGANGGVHFIIGDLIVNGGTYNMGGVSMFTILRQNLEFNGGAINSQTSFLNMNSDNFNQRIIGNVNGSNALYRLQIFNRGGSNVFDFEDDVEISNELVLRDGIVNTNGNKVILGSSAIVTYTSAESYINGRVVKTLPTVGDDFIFPIGSASKWRPAYVQNVTTGGLDWEAEYFEGAATNEAIVTNLTPADISILTMSTEEYWKISDGNATPSGVNATVGLSWGIDSYVSSVSAEREQMEVMVWNTTNSNWDNYGGANFSSGHTQSQGTLNSSSVVSFSENIFTLGSTDLANPLPVELVSFTGKEKDEEVLLSWQTASELNNDYFIVEHSVDGQVFTEIGDMPGAGTTTVIQYYSYTHNLPSYPDNYYRLKQVDFDGAFEYSDVILVRMKNVLSSDEMDFIMYPNPTSDATVNIELSSLDYSKSLLIEVVNLNGMRILSEHYETGNFGRTINLDLGYSIKRGIYIVRIAQNDRHVVKKLVVR